MIAVMVKTKDNDLFLSIYFVFKVNAGAAGHLPYPVSVFVNNVITLCFGLPVYLCRFFFFTTPV